MALIDRSELAAHLEPFGQQHVLRFWEQLASPQRERLASQVRSIDLELIARVYRGGQEGLDATELAKKASSPPAVRLDGSGTSFRREEAVAAGEAALRAGRLGMILVAGGQGSRLGFPHPKGMFPLGPLSQRTLYEMLIDRLQAVANRYGVSIPLYLMTSAATHSETVDFLQQHDRFGLAEEDLRIFQQGTMPAVDAATGRLLMSAEDAICLSPDGHGGTVRAMEQSGCLAHTKQRGLQHLFYGQVDNPLVQIGDPYLLGHHLLAQSEMTTQVVAKRDPLENVGNVVAVNGQVRIIEYSDLPAQAAQRQKDGRYELWAGNIAVHIFETSFLQRMAQAGETVLPLHRAHKAMPCLDERGTRIEPSAPNAYKFERFIFDLLPAAKNAIAVEADQREAFAPVKNSDTKGVDSPATARQILADLHRGWLREAGATVADDTMVEINPRWALDAEQVKERLAAGDSLDFSEPTYLNEPAKRRA